MTIPISGLRSSARELMLDFQGQALTFLTQRQSAFLVGAGGCGKTLMEIAAALDRTPPGKPILTLTKASVRLQYAKEVARFAEGLGAPGGVQPFVVQPGSGTEELADYLSWTKFARDADGKPVRPFIIAGWSNLQDATKVADRSAERAERKRQALLADENLTPNKLERALRALALPPRVQLDVIRPHTIVGDESHLAKSWRRVRGRVDPDTGRTKWKKTLNLAAQAAKLFRASSIRYRLLATATPMPDNLTDLWSQLDLLQPGRWGRSSYDFAVKYGGAVPGEYGGLVLTDTRDDLLLPRLEPLMWNIPYETSHRALLGLRRRELWHIPLEDQDTSISEVDLLRERRRESFQEDGRAISTLQVGLEVAAARGRPAIVARLLEESLSRGGNFKAVVLDDNVEAVEALGAAIRKSGAFRHVYVVHGQAGSLEGRERIRDAYLHHPGGACLVATGSSVGTGWNLQDTDMLMFARLPWNPGTLHQWEQRVSRLGQTRPVLVVYAIPIGTYAEALAQMNLAKLPAVEKIIQDGVVSGAGDVLRGLGNDPAALDRFADSVLACFEQMTA